MLKSLASKGIDFVSQRGPARELIEAIDWSQTSIGTPENWPQSLRSALSICFNSNFPIAVYWGANLVLMYNEAWSPIPGNKHPWAFGRPAIEVWPDIWPDIEPQFKKAFSGVPGGSKDALLPMQRHGYTEECYFDFTFTPVYGESGNVEGIFNAVIETTYRVINERRGGILQRLSEAISGLTTDSEVFLTSANVLEEADKDLSFFCFFDYTTGKPLLASCSHSVEASRMQDWPFDEVLSFGSTIMISDLEAIFDVVPTRYWLEKPVEALMVPLKRNDGAVLGFVVGGLSARRRADKDYKGFIESIANVVSGELNTLQALTKERERAESLAQLDRAKSAFFSNISHEFRTPLTLMTGPLEEVLNSADNLSESHKDDIQTSLRNALRLQKLVNSLLDFSKIEAGKLETNLQHVDIGQLTKDFASSFRSVIESAGIAYRVHVNSSSELVLIDPDMWEKIVLNLISNSFKYTERGSISVELVVDETMINLSVSDTGIGISAEHLDKIFERFYRVNSDGGRSQEGTGIGLAMVRELVLLHKGEVRVESTSGQGATFTVLLPIHTREQGRDSVGTRGASPSGAQKAFVEEALKWDSASALKTGSLKSTGLGAKVIVADDNSDMRGYITRILSNDFEVVSVDNGKDAYLAAQQIIPDLILTDVMMPKLDGFGLLRKLKSNLTTRNIPVIFLSARAGEEARIEGIEAGVDDYVVKPFSAKELLARVGNTIAINKVRLDTEKEFFRLFLQLPAHIHLFTGPEHVVEFFHPLGKKIIGRDITGQKIREAIPEVAGQGYFELLDKVYQTGETVSLPVSKVLLPGDDGQVEELFFSITYLPWRDVNRSIRGVLQFTFDVTEQTKANLKIKESEERFRILANSIPQFVWIADENGKVEFISNQWEKYTDIPAGEGKTLFSSLIHEDDIEQVNRLWRESFNAGTSWTSEFRLKNVTTNEFRWFSGHTVPLKDEHGIILKWIGSASDITQQKNLHFQLEEIVAERTNELLALNKILRQRNDELAKAQNFLKRYNDQLTRSNEDLQQFAHVTSHDLKEPVRKIKMYGNILGTEYAQFLPDKGRDYVAKIEKATARISSMIDGVLQYASVDVAEQALQRIDLNETIRNITEDLEIPISQFGAEIDHENLPVIFGYPTLVYQLFYNLINNSLKFRRKDIRPKIKIAFTPVAETVLTETSGNYFMIELKDNGVGFEQVFAEKIFESFTRLYPKDVYEGTGLGLALCRKIVARHGGIIKAEGEPNRGARFKIYLPQSILFN